MDDAQLSEVRARLDKLGEQVAGIAVSIALLLQSSTIDAEARKTAAKHVDDRIDKLEGNVEKLLAWKTYVLGGAAVLIALAGGTSHLLTRLALDPAPAAHAQTTEREHAEKGER